MAEDINSMEQQNPELSTASTKKRKLSIRRVLGNAWRKIIAEVNGDECRRTNDFGENYYSIRYIFCKVQRASTKHGHAD